MPPGPSSQAASVLKAIATPPTGTELLRSAWRKILGATPQCALWRGKSALPLFIRPMRVISVHSLIRKPAFWVLLGTIMIPFNVILAIAFWAHARIGGAEDRAPAARRLNVQLTYTSILFLPLLLASLFSSTACRAIFPAGALSTAIVGLTLGLIALSGVIVLVFANTHSFACEVHDCEVDTPGHLGIIARPLRIRFFPE